MKKQENTFYYEIKEGECGLCAARDGHAMIDYMLAARKVNTIVKSMQEAREAHKARKTKQI